LKEEYSLFDLIEKYHRGALSEAERQHVEDRIRNENAFADYVHLHAMTDKLVLSAGIDMLRAQMSADLAKIEQRRIRKNWILGIGIVAVVILLCWIIYSGRTTTRLTQQVATDQAPALPSEILTPAGTATTTPEPALPQKMSKAKRILQSNARIHETPPEADNSLYTTEQKKLADTILRIAPSYQDTYKAQSPIPSFIPVPVCTLSFQTTVRPTCRGEHEGSITIDEKNISGGTPPYSFHLSETEQSNSSGFFTNLKSGRYTVVVDDSKACRSVQETTIDEKKCIPRKSFSFNPDYGEVWHLPESEKSGTFVLYNRGGIAIFTGTLNANTTVEWPGIYTSGSLAEPGLYICTINYSDGETEIFEISIVR
jgi:hypothetical protein